MTNRSMTRFVLAALAALSAASLAVSCGGNDKDNGSSAGSGCTIAGNKCQFACSTDLGCVECTSNSDCGAAQRYCVLGRCETCMTASDCPSGEACYPREHNCQPACTATSCGGDAPYCDPNLNACVGCRDSQDCAGTNRPICSHDTRQCAECGADSDCGAAQPVCNLRAGECVQCLVDGDCQSGFRCAQDHRCHSSCQSNADCTDPGRPLCNVDNGDCVECLKPADCPAATPACSNDGRCVQCAVNADCTNAAAPICHGDHCVQCENPADCVNQPNCANGACKCKAQQCSP